MEDLKKELKELREDIIKMYEKIFLIETSICDLEDFLYED